MPHQSCQLPDLRRSRQQCCSCPPIRSAAGSTHALRELPPRASASTRSLSESRHARSHLAARRFSGGRGGPVCEARQASLLRSALPARLPFARLDCRNRRGRRGAECPWGKGEEGRGAPHSKLVFKRPPHFQRRSASPFPRPPSPFSPCISPGIASSTLPASACR